MPERRTRTAIRIAGFYVVSFAIVSLVVGAATWRLTGNAFRHTLDDRLRDELVALEHADEREGREALIADIVAFDAIPGNGRYLLNSPDGKRLAGRASITRLPEDIGDTMLRATDGHFEPARVVRMTLQDGSTLAVIGETAAMDRTERTLLLIAAAGFGLVIVIGVLGGILSGRTLHRRLSLVDGTAQAIIKGDLTRRMPISAANDEFDQLSATLNQMLDHIGRLMASLRHVSADIAHDLRSPLTRLRAKLETALHSKEAEAQSEAIADALERMDEILNLFATMLRISEVEAGGIKQWFKPVALAPLIGEIVENYGPSAQDSGHRLEIGQLDDLTVKGSEDLIGQIIANLIENGLRHTPAGSRIIVALAQTHEGAAELSVADDGPGIHESQHALALQRFGRGEASRSRPGHGLGLAMVQSIATAHGAALILGDARPGLAVKVIFRL
ncbi:MAG: sensor histidine kinase [Sphingobium sp.]